jgi:hypothetical protein
VRIHGEPRIKSIIQSSHGINKYNKRLPVDLGGLVVSVLATGPKVRGFDPDRGRWIFKGDKNPEHVKCCVSPSLLTACQMALTGTSVSIETVARPVDQSPTATNAHDLVTSKRGGKRRPGPI